MVELIDVAHRGPAQQRTAAIAELAGRATDDFDLTALRMFQQPADMQQRRLAGAGGRDQRDHLAAEYREIGVLEHMDEGFALAIMPVHSLEREVHLTHSAAPRPDRTGRRARLDRALQGS